MKACRRDLGTMDYASCWELQRSLFEELTARKKKAKSAGTNADEERSAGRRDRDAARGTGACGDLCDPIGTVLLVEHPPVYTLGKSGHAENLLVDRATLERLGARFFHIDRGGDITFHGPGQLVCYPILDLERIGIGLRDYIDALEEAVIRTVAGYGIAAGRIAGASGVWIEDGTEKDRPEKDRPEKRETPGTPGTLEPLEPLESRAATQENRPAKSGRGLRKICAIGVRASRFVTMHGLALNVSTDLEWFSRIHPCGFADRGVTSIERECGRKIAMDEVSDSLVAHLSEILNVKIYK